MLISSYLERLKRRTYFPLKGWRKLNMKWWNRPQKHTNFSLCQLISSVSLSGSGWTNVRYPWLHCRGEMWHHTTTVRGVWSWRGGAKASDELCFHCFFKVHHEIWKLKFFSELFSVVWFWSSLQLFAIIFLPTTSDKWPSANIWIWLHYINLPSLVKHCLHHFFSVNQLSPFRAEKHIRTPGCFAVPLLCLSYFPWRTGEVRGSCHV